MNKIVKYILIALLVVLVVLQFFQPDLNQYDQIPSTDITKVETIPADVSKILTESCYDCHSNNTNYPWYNRISPVSLYLDSHVKDGKRHLNFSEWTSYSADKKAHKVEEIAETVADGEMPLTSYTFIHSDAKLSESEKEILLNWAKNYQP